MKPKIIAFYLPQFHAIPENDEWWGKGFTEWSNTKKAKPLFKGHYQPREPLNDYYYDLLDKRAQSWQVRLAQKYGIYGFCYYHYWLNGKLLLEKPMEQMLANETIDLPFCISWANHHWTRNWDGRPREVLMPQSYGDKDEWEAHLHYLLPFFKDKRYISLANKPVFLLYRAAAITQCKERIDYWNDRLKEEGFDGIYIIETLTNFQKESCLLNSQAQVEFEPMLTYGHYLPFLIQICRYLKAKLLRFGLHPLDVLDYNLLWETITKRQKSCKKRTYLCAFVDWDNSARRGRDSLIVPGANPDDFAHYFDVVYRNSGTMKNEFLFINAWNEWAEGAYLEPDKIHKTGYLEAILDVIEKN